MYNNICSAFGCENERLKIRNNTLHHCIEHLEVDDFDEYDFREFVLEQILLLRKMIKDE